MLVKMTVNIILVFCFSHLAMAEGLHEQNSPSSLNESLKRAETEASAPTITLRPGQSIKIEPNVTSKIVCESEGENKLPKCLIYSSEVKFVIRDPGAKADRTRDGLTYWLKLSGKPRPDEGHFIEKETWQESHDLTKILETAQRLKSLGLCGEVIIK